MTSRTKKAKQTKKYFEADQKVDNPVDKNEKLESTFKVAETVTATTEKVFKVQQTYRHKKRTQPRRTIFPSRISRNSRCSQ